MSEYRSKYMKYKNRYLDLKKRKSLKQFGGSSEKDKQENNNEEENNDGGDGIGDNANTSETIDAEGIGDNANTSETIDTDADDDNDGSDQEDEDNVDEIVNTDADVIDTEQELQLSEIEGKLNKPLYSLTDEEKSKRPTLVGFRSDTIPLTGDFKNLYPKRT